MAYVNFCDFYSNLSPSDLQRRGCVRTSFEFARLLYSLDPWNDPHGSLLHLDFLAIKAGMTSWLIDVFDLFAERRANNTAISDARLDPSSLPGWAYARALALKVSEDATKDKVRPSCFSVFDQRDNFFLGSHKEHSSAEGGCTGLSVSCTAPR